MGIYSGIARLQPGRFMALTVVVGVAAGPECNHVELGEANSGPTWSILCVVISSDSENHEVLSEAKSRISAFRRDLPTAS